MNSKPSLSKEELTAILPDSKEFSSLSRNQKRKWKSIHSSTDSKVIENKNKGFQPQKKVIIDVVSPSSNNLAQSSIKIDEVMIGHGGRLLDNYSLPAIIYTHLAFTPVGFVGSFAYDSFKAFFRSMMLIVKSRLRAEEKESLQEENFWSYISVISFAYSYCSCTKLAIDKDAFTGIIGISSFDNFRFNLIRDRVIEELNLLESYLFNLPFPENILSEIKFLFSPRSHKNFKPIRWILPADPFGVIKDFDFKNSAKLVGDLKIIRERLSSLLIVEIGSILQNKGIYPDLRIRDISGIALIKEKDPDFDDLWINLNRVIHKDGNPALSKISNQSITFPVDESERFIFMIPFDRNLLNYSIYYNFLSRNNNSDEDSKSSHMTSSPFPNPVGKVLKSYCIGKHSAQLCNVVFHPGLIMPSFSPDASNSYHLIRPVSNYHDFGEEQVDSALSENTAISVGNKHVITKNELGALVLSLINLGFSPSSDHYVYKLSFAHLSQSIQIYIADYLLQKDKLVQSDSNKVKGGTVS